jgi:hypothetical protein
MNNKIVLGIIIVFALVFDIIIYTCTDYRYIDDIKDYSEDYEKTENSDFDNINLGLKIMPSYNFKKNVIYMKHINDIYKTNIPNSISLMEKFDMKNTYFFINNTENYYPKLHFRKEYIPAGNSVSLCLSIYWSGKESIFLIKKRRREC